MAEHDGQANPSQVSQPIAGTLTNLTTLIKGKSTALKNFQIIHTPQVGLATNVFAAITLFSDRHGLLSVNHGGPLFSST
jgi:hypothetical protein